MVYVISNGSHYKIGHTRRDPQRRLEQLQQGSPSTLELVAVIPGDITEELLLHRRYASKRLSGEWFLLSDDDICEIQKSGAYYRERLESVLYLLSVDKLLAPNVTDE